jgi:YHS domain-containing protein
MNHFRSLLFFAVAAPFLTVAVHAHASQPAGQAEMAGKLVPVSGKTDATWLAKARADYPLNSCVVSGDKFDGGEMGKRMDYIYKVSGKPDRLVRFCCKDCVDDFEKDPAKYLRGIDDASSAKTDAAK